MTVPLSISYSSNRDEGGDNQRGAVHWLEPVCLKPADTAQVLKPQLVDFSAGTDKPVGFRASFEAGEGQERNRVKAVEKEGRRMKGVDCETYSR